MGKSIERIGNAMNLKSNPREKLISQPERLAAPGTSCPSESEVLVPTRTADTVDKYLDRAQQILARIPDRYMSCPDIGLHPVEVAHWLKDEARELSKNTFYQYRAAFIAHFEAVMVRYPDASVRSDHEAGILALRALSAALCPKKRELPMRTSAGKVKRLPLDDLATLGRHLLAKRAFWPPRCYSFLVAGLATGLRPSEWATAEVIQHMDDGGIRLRLQNAKNTNGRANGEFREIDIPSGWTSDYVIRHIDSVQVWLAEGKPFTSYFRESARALHLAVRMLWSDPTRHYSLYSSRHQFAANQKKAGMSLREIADLMGHSSDDTARNHYGKRRSGYSLDILKSIALSVKPTPPYDHRDHAPVGPT